ncbi:hypothetical protein MUP77_02070 [Candidatus Bathyarchaeota archaeon]|nr:hypothetical protein [Candidatus Bathyarchaeota archaeon]
MDTWIEANIFVNQENQHSFLKNFIKPLIRDLKSKGEIISYHFLHEENYEIRFRILANESKIEGIRKLIEESRKQQGVTDLKYPEAPYVGERISFGEDGWITTYKFLEAGSDFALDMIDQNVRKGPYFNYGSFSHYFLNQCGLNQFQEANVHLDFFVERITTIIFQNMHEQFGKRLDQLETSVKNLQPQTNPPASSTS